jgi:hypothetical protein
MAETKPGGAYLRPDGKTWVNAQGEPTDAPARAQRRAHDEQQAEAERQAAEAPTETPATRRARG